MPQTTTGTSAALAFHAHRRRPGMSREPPTDQTRMPRWRSRRCPVCAHSKARALRQSGSHKDAHRRMFKRADHAPWVRVSAAILSARQSGGAKNSSAIPSGSLKLSPEP